MMKLYYAETLNPRKVCALARYLGSPVEFVRVDMAKGQHRTADFAQGGDRIVIAEEHHPGLRGIHGIECGETGAVE